jgi:hypothetical protein
VFELSSGEPAERVGLRAITRFREAARDPGLDVPSPYVVAGDYCGALQTVLEAIGRLTLLTLAKGPLISLGPHSWQVVAFTDESGELHRWSVVDALDESSLYRDLHSWHVAGDMAATDAPMTIHFVSIGSFRAGRLHSPWTRAWAHPAIANHYRFQARDGKKLKGDWRAVWFAEDRQDAKVWVDLMERDNLSLISHHPLKQLSPENVERIREQITSEVNRLSTLGPLPTIPLYRPACDFPTICPWQDKCYA